MDTIIVSRHTGAVEWLRQHGIVGEVLAQVTDPAQIAGRVVVGALPLHLAAVAVEVMAIDMPGLRADQRGKDLTPAEMDAAGASLGRYRVIRLPDVPTQELEWEAYWSEDMQEQALRVQYDGTLRGAGRVRSLHPGYAGW
ncbi:MAG TPA: CRISPR-associated protein Csx16 [Verrucomicrobiota bacterium]|nr:CRISPR-associated protein Csx16 [Verrucomicrobiota bacterium]